MKSQNIKKSETEFQYSIQELVNDSKNYNLFIDLNNQKDMENLILEYKTSDSRTKL